MDPAGIIVLPRRRTDPFELDLAHIEAAIELVRNGQAARVRLVGLADAADLAPIGLARAQAVGLDFAVERHDDALTLTFGPRLRTQ
jgi:hypothetical protein